jgi:hypothetical protein
VKSSIRRTTLGSSINAITRIGTLFTVRHFRHASGSTSYTLRMSRTKVTLARVTNSLTGASVAEGVFAGCCALSAFARSPRGVLVRLYPQLSAGVPRRQATRGALPTAPTLCSCFLIRRWQYPIKNTRYYNFPLIVPLFWWDEKTLTLVGVMR